MSASLQRLLVLGGHSTGRPGFTRAPARPRLPTGIRQFCALVAALAAASVFALNPNEKTADYIAAHWNVEDGLPHNAVKALFQTRDGYLWIGTNFGLARFDGLSFTVFTKSNTPGIPNNQITSLTEMPDRSLWIGTADGLVRYQDGKFTSYSMADGLKSKTINAVCPAPDGSLWIGGQGGITRWIAGKFVNDIDTSAYDMLGLRAIQVDRRNAIWITAGAAVLRYQDGVFRRFGRAEGLASDRVQQVCEDATGRMLAVTQSGLFRLDGERFVSCEFNGALASLQVSTAVVDRGGSLWIGSTGGLERVYHDQVVRYADRYGQKLGVADAVLEDREGCLWVGTAEGLYRFTDRRIHSLTLEQGIAGELITAVMQARDASLWIAGWGSGITRIQGDTITRYQRGAPLSHETVTNIYEAPGGAMWLGNRGSAVDRLEGGKVATYVYAPGVPTSRPVTALYVDENGTLLIGIDKRGLLELRDGQIRPVPELAAWAADRTVTVWTFHRTSDNWLLVGTSAGLFQRQGDRSWQLVPVPGLPGPVVVKNVLEEADGTLWFVTDGLGLVRWHRGSDARSFGSRQGMLDDSLFYVLDDGIGSLWVCSARGIGRIRKSEFTALERGDIAMLNCITFGRVDGLASASAPGEGGPAACRLADGRLMFATDQGVAVIDPRSLQTNSQPPTVVIESVIADDQPLALASGQTVSIPPGTNRFEIRYTAMSLVAPQRLRFRYQLAGSDPRWIEAGGERSARYTHLAPGSYVFHVLACNNDGVWSETGATLAVTMQPLFYQTLWFRLAGLALLGGALAGTVGLRLLQLKRREQALARSNVELDRRVRERTAELAEASGLLEAMLENSPDLIYFKDRDSRFVRFSKACLSHLGLTEPEMLHGKTDADFYASGDAQSTRADEQEIIRHGQPIVGKLEQHTYPDGRTVWNLTTKMPWRDGAGAIVGTFGISRDVTVLKDTEGKLTYERDLLRALLDSSPDQIYFKDLRSRFLRTSIAQAKNFGVPSPDEVVGKTDFDFFTDEHARPAFEDEQEIIRTGRPLIGKVEKETWHDGRETWVITSKMALRNNAGEIIGTMGISKDITPLKRAEAKLEQLHQQLVETSRQAGMAEVATAVLHNVGNVLNSVNVSATLVADRVRHSQAGNVAKLATLVDEHKADLVGFLTRDPRGRMIPGYLGTLAELFAAEQKTLLTEIEHLRKNIEHIKDIVAMQQAHAQTSGIVAAASVPEMIEDALRINADALTRHGVHAICDFQARPVIATDRHKVMQILINLVRNAKLACVESGRTDRQITVRTTSDGRDVQIAVCDNGIGIPAENLTRIFSHGFTTRKDGHGFALHSGALAARELGGALTAHSDGPGKGATFILKLPLNSATPGHENPVR